MHTPNTHRSSRILLSTYGLYLEARLRAEAETAGLVELLQRAGAGLIGATAREQAAHDRMVLALAARNHADLEMSRLISAFELAVLAHVHRDRSSPTYLRFFPKGLKRITESSPERRAESAQMLEAALAAVADADALKPFLPNLAEHRRNLERAIAALRDARIEHLDARRAEVDERSRWIGAYRTVFAELTKLHPTDPELVASFFRPSPPRDGADEAEP